MLKELVYTVFLAIAAIGIHLYWEQFQMHMGKRIELESVFGKLVGQEGISRQGRIIYKFTSIPYAIPPLGKLRFEPPVKYGKWEGTLDARKPSPICTQMDFISMERVGQEDCLYLNVYTPKLKGDSSDNLLPVMFFIHGGYFMYGSSLLYTPDYLLDEDVILVTLNYRLNVFGFLNSGDGIARGNQGLKDQVMALKWVKEAISGFGGDPNLVTAIGNSAGGVSVNFHMISAMSQGLFQRGISQSGTNLCPWALVMKPEKQAKRFAKLVGCPTKSSQEMVDCLREIPADHLVNFHKETLDNLPKAGALFGPSLEFIDASTDWDKTFLSESPTKLMQEGKFSRIPWINGVNDHEGCIHSSLIVSDPEALKKCDEKWNGILHLNSKDLALNNKVRDEYFPRDGFKLNKREITIEDIENITNLFSDRLIFGCSSQSSIYHSRHAPVYSYYFTKRPNIGFGYILEVSRGVFPFKIGIVFGYIRFLFYHNVLGWRVDKFRTCHTDELQQLFPLSPELAIGKDSPNYPFSTNFVKLWVSFAKHGKPDPFLGIEWESQSRWEFDAERDQDRRDFDLKYLAIHETPEMIPEPFASRMQFWKELYNGAIN